MISVAMLLTALLFGGMTLFSFGFAAVLFNVFDAPVARKGIRGAFPFYYLWVLVTASLAGLATLFVNAVAGFLLIGIALSTAYARQVLMVQINATTDSGDKNSFKWLHSLSVAIQLVQIGVAGWAVVLLA
ncbi:DUF4149 domain-containing protein [Tateyamaria sp.]|uniref:DUF4149 domain-containing protein n=1 Tax=Tateyamaria sp. TaxID=1929288 RepID=UPI0032A0BE7F